MKTTDNLKHPAQRLADAPRCTATAKSTRCRCNAPAVKGWTVCRMHGARGGAPSGPAYARGARNRNGAGQPIKGGVQSLPTVQSLTGAALRSHCEQTKKGVWGRDKLPARLSGDRRHSVPSINRKKKGLRGGRFKALAESDRDRQGMLFCLYAKIATKGQTHTAQS